MSEKHCTRNGDAESVRFCADEEALARVLEAARGPAGAVAQRVVRNWHTAEDVVQEALLRAVVAQDRLQSKNNLQAWFRDGTSGTACRQRRLSDWTGRSYSVTSIILPS